MQQTERQTRWRMILGSQAAVLITRPDDTVLILISDLYEGGNA